MTRKKSKRIGKEHEYDYRRGGRDRDGRQGQHPGTPSAGGTGIYRRQYGYPHDRPGELFVALKGERFDGHVYAGKAVAAGARGVVVSGPVEVPDGTVVFQVADTLAAYQDIARAWRLRFPDLKVVAITGSNGKTSTKDMVAAVLGAKYRVVKTEANFNNEIGLPRTLLQIRPDTEIAVVEMGMRALGQIKAMCAIACPDVAVVTNVGATHLGELGSLDNIARAKSEILEDLPADGFAVLNGDLPRVRAMAQKVAVPVAWFGLHEDDDVRATDLAIGADRSAFRCHAGGEEETLVLPATGEHNVMNALAAIAVGRHFGVKLNDMKPALANLSLTGSRQEVLHFGPYTVLNDAYNASPASMEAAFATLARLKEAGSCRTIAVVADMLELGSLSAEAHTEVGHLAAKAHTDFLLAYGPESVHAWEAARADGVTAWHFADRAGAEARLREILRPGDVVLLKGSHSMAVDGILGTVFQSF